MRPGNMASASFLCRFGHSCTEYSMPQTVVVTGMSMSLRNKYTDSAKRVLLAQVRQRDLVFLPGKAPVKVVNEEHCIRIYACVVLVLS